MIPADEQIATLEKLRDEAFALAQQNHWKECECDLVGEDKTCKSESAARYRALDFALARLAQTCESCRFAGATSTMRACHLLMSKDNGTTNPTVRFPTFQYVPLAVNGRPFSCAGWQAKETPRCSTCAKWRFGSTRRLTILAARTSIARSPAPSPACERTRCHERTTP